MRPTPVRLSLIEPQDPCFLRSLHDKRSRFYPRQHLEKDTAFFSTPHGRQYLSAALQCRRYTDRRTIPRRSPSRRCWERLHAHDLHHLHPDRPHDGERRLLLHLPRTKEHRTHEAVHLYFLPFHRRALALPECHLLYISGRDHPLHADPRRRRFLLPRLSPMDLLRHHRRLPLQLLCRPPARRGKLTHPARLPHRLRPPEYRARPSLHPGLPARRRRRGQGDRHR